MGVYVLNKTPVICYNILIIGIIIYSLLIFYLGFAEITLKNIIASHLIITIGIIMNLFLLIGIKKGDL